ncbi:Protein kinase, putative [Hondaea fermentalgiana]|uniref:non-specific serine/threonine protein kinase n=1 Tax=Hondaea fermentalgiana TaxID=2315210 RepID=A0A2R5GFK6_9STRA|nr:Protein kinase, putative [Hondaea fermentalgiana]|eukprot:GBG27413.1 Protein kinase, putative [Hondaea fermentalgiana]
MPSFFFNTDEFNKRYRVSRTLGTGSFATVKVCTLKEDKNVQRAVKIMNLLTMKAEDAEALETEMQILYDMDHPNIVKLYETYRSKKNVYLVMELMMGGEMFDRIVEKEHYEESMARRDLISIAKALEYCHKQDIVHRDLKPENLLYSDETNDAVVKLADFGLAKVCKEEPFMKTACGTPGYVAPEILQGDKYDFKVDVWSFGVIAYILLCGFPPFYHPNNAELFRQIKRGKYEFPSPYWDDVSQDAKDFINFMLVTNPVERPTISEVLQHKWLQGDANSNLTGNLDKLREYNATRKFKNAVNGIKAVARMRKSLAGGDHAADISAAVTASGKKMATVP